MGHELLQVARAVPRVVLHEVVAQAGAHEEVLHSLHLACIAVELGEGPVVDREELADRRVDAGGAAAGGVGLGAGAGHPPHVGGGPAQVGDRAPEAGVLRQGLHLPQHALPAARGDVAPLVLGDAAEGAPGGAAAQDGDAPADLLQRRDVGPAVGGVGVAGVGELVHRVELGRAGRRHGLVHHHVAHGRAASVALHQDPRVLVVVLGVVEAREGREGALVGGHLLEGREDHRGAGPPLEPGDGEVGDRERRAGHVHEAAEVLARRQPARDLHDRLLPLPVHEQVGAALHQHRGAHPVVPVVVVGDAAQRGLHAAHHDGHRRAEGLPRQAGVNGHGAVGAPAGRPGRRVGIVGAWALVCGVVVDEGVHGPGGDAHQQPGAPEPQEVVAPVPAGLGHHAHPEPA